MSDEKIELLIPGPVPVSPDVLAAMAEPVRQHFGPSWLPFYHAFAGRLRRVFATQGSVYPIPASGSGGIEVIVSSLMGGHGRAGVVVNGFFGDRMLRIARSHSKDVEALEVPADRPADPDDVRAWIRAHRLPLVAVVHSDTSTGVINPVPDLARVAREEGAVIIVDAVSSLGGMPVLTDEWGLAAVSSASQKCLETPPGLAPVAVTQAGWDYIDRQASPSHGWYLNLRTWRQYEQEWTHHPYPVTIAVNNIVALNRALERIIEEGFEARYERHRKAAGVLRERLEQIGFRMFADRRWASPTVSVAYPPEGVDAGALIRAMRERHRIAIAGGLLDLAGKVVRIGHLGTQAYPETMLRVTAALEACVREGVPSPR